MAGTDSEIGVLCFDAGASLASSVPRTKIVGPVTCASEEDSHSLRTASVIARTYSSSSGRSLRIDSCPTSLLYSANVLRDLTEIFRADQYVVACVAWSAIPRRDVMLSLAPAFELLAALGCLVVAASGHDGKGRTRFPALLPSVLSVGVLGKFGLPTEYCSFSEYGAKPELWVPEELYPASGVQRAPHPIGGTSGAAARVTAEAAMLADLILSRGTQPNPSLLKALLLACSDSLKGRRMLRSDKIKDVDRLIWTQIPSLPRQHRAELTLDGSAESCVVLAAPSYLRGPPDVRPRTEVIGLQDGTACQKFFDCMVIDSTLPLTATLPPGSCEWIAGYGVRDLKIEAGTSGIQPRYTVGISASHNASACLLDDSGLVVRAIQQERLSRKKADGEPFLQQRQPVEYCLRSYGISLAQVADFAFNIQPLLPGWTGLNQPVCEKGFGLFDPFGDKAIFVSHHLSHAFAGFCASQFKEAIVFVADGAGGATVGNEADLILSGAELREYLQTKNYELPQIHVLSAYEFNTQGFRLIGRRTAPSFNVRCGSSSAGEMYAAVSNYVFGDWLDGSGKLMGLAPYGNADNIPSFLTAENGRLRIGNQWKLNFPKEYERHPMKHADLAARVQADFERYLMSEFEALVPTSYRGDLVFSGGLALNCVLNQRIATSYCAARTFFFPASNDAGIAPGAAYAARFKRTGRIGSAAARSSVWLDGLGHPYSDEECEPAIREFEDALEVTEYAHATVAEDLLSGGVVAMFIGGSEFGPRALGHRSLLAVPSKKETWGFINSSIKGREDFRPFAPVVTEEDAATYFDIAEPSPYMMRVVPVKEQYRERLAAVCHVDGTARVQTLSREAHPLLHRLLNRICESTGLPILLNTSLNIAGEPIVEVPHEAVRILLTRPIAGLVLGKRYLRKKCWIGQAVPAGARLMLPSWSRLELARSRYTETCSIHSRFSRQAIRLRSELFEFLMSGSYGSRGSEAIVTVTELQSLSDRQLLAALTWQGYLLYLGGGTSIPRMDNDDTKAELHAFS